MDNEEGTVNTRYLCPVSLCVLVLFVGCGRGKQSSSASEDSSANPAAAPAPPVPSFSAVDKIGQFAYPKNNQMRDQPFRDELDCYNQVQQQTSINPETPPPTPPTSAELQAAQQQAAAQAPEAKGGRARGAARGAAGGAMVGAIAGEAGKGAAAGAVVCTMQGGMKQREANAASKEQAAQAGSAQVQQRYQQAKAEYNKEIVAAGSLSVLTVLANFVPCFNSAETL